MTRTALRPEVVIVMLLLAVALPIGVAGWGWYQDSSGETARERAAERLSKHIEQLWEEYWLQPSGVIGPADAMIRWQVTDQRWNRTVLRFYLGEFPFRLGPHGTLREATPRTSEDRNGGELPDWSRVMLVEADALQLHLPITETAFGWPWRMVSVVESEHALEIAGWHVLWRGAVRNVLVFAVGLFVLRAVYFGGRRGWRRLRRGCVECGHPVFDAARTGVCPECGAVIRGVAKRAMDDVGDG